MNIYDEALKELKKIWNGNPLNYSKKTVKALERAKKVEVLLGLYRNLSMETEVEGRMYYWQDINDLEKELEEMEDE